VTWVLSGQGLTYALLWVAIGIVVSSLVAGILLFLRTPSD
jgi:hypothetical protein